MNSRVKVSTVLVAVLLATFVSFFVGVFVAGLAGGRKEEVASSDTHVQKIIGDEETGKPVGNVSMTIKEATDLLRDGDGNDWLSANYHTKVLICTLLINDTLFQVPKDVKDVEVITSQARALYLYLEECYTKLSVNPHFPDDSVRFGMQFAPTL